MSFSAPHLIGSIIFGSIGFVAFVYGKKQSRMKPMIIGALLVAFPYLITNTIAMYVIGVFLTASLYFFRD